MSVNTISTAYHNPVKMPVTTDIKVQKKPKDNVEIIKLNAEIQEAEAEIKETMKEVQKVTADSTSGSSDKAKILQSKILIQQQSVMMKQMQVKEIESPTKSIIEQASKANDGRPKFDQYIAEKYGEKTSDNVYSLKEKDGARRIIFNRVEE